jgi:hypothetical protein
VLSAFLRLAEALDRSRNTVVRALTVRQRGEELVLQLQAAGDAELEVWAANRQLRSLEDVLDRSVRIETRHVEEDGDPSRRRAPVTGASAERPSSGAVEPVARRARRRAALPNPAERADAGRGRPSA